MIAAAAWAAVATAGWTPCAAWAAGAWAVVVRTRACVVAAGTVASRARALWAWCARLLAVRVVGTGIGMVGGKAGRVAGMPVRARRTLLSFTLSGAAWALGACTTRTA